MSAPQAPVTSIVFDRRKYGPELHIDACAIGAIPGFITTPRPHRLRFYEIALITGGRGVLQLDSAASDVRPGSVHVTAPGEVRRWRLTTPRLDGLLVFFEADVTRGLFDSADPTARLPALAGPTLAAPSRAFDKLLALAGDMCSELRRPRPDSAAVLRADTHRLLVALQRAAGSAPGRSAARAPAASARARAIVARFDELVEQRYLFDPSLASYAERLGLGTRQLGAVVRQVTGTTPAERIRRRQGVEARRLLRQSNLSVSAIAERLSFSDASYFIRFFKRQTGVTPLRFRDGADESHFFSAE